MHEVDELSAVSADKEDLDSSKEEDKEPGSVVFE